MSQGLASGGGIIFAGEPVARTNALPVGIGDGPWMDAFGRLRVSSPFTIFDSQFQYGLNTLLWDTAAVGGGTSSNVLDRSTVQISVSTGATDSFVLQSHRYFRYQPGKSQNPLMTFVMGAAVANVRKRVGYFDDSDGLIFEQNGTTDVAFTLRTSTSGSVSNANRVTQANWNLDPLDGSGPSGLTLDLSKAQLLNADLQWLSVGRVRVGFEIGGLIVYAHQFQAANILTVPYMKTANLPLRYEIANTAGSAGASMDCICATVMAEGGRDPSGIQHSVANGITTIGVTTRRPILTIRPKLTFAGVTNRGLVLPLHFDIIADADTFYELVYNGTLSGGAGTFTSAGTNSIAQYNVDHTGITGGEIVRGGYIAAGSGAAGGQIPGIAGTDILRLTQSMAGVRDTLSLVATSFTGTANCSGEITFREDF